MASNLGDLYNKLLALVQGNYGLLHDEVNNTGVGVGEGNWTASRAGWRKQDGTGETGEVRV